MREHEAEDDITIEPDEETHAHLKGRSEKDLRNELKKVQGEKEEYLLGWQRAKADLINYKREVEEGRVQFAKLATEDLIHRILPVLDNFKMALSHTKGVESNWLRGMEHVYKQLSSILKTDGLEEIDPLGEEFNPSLHESVGSSEVDKEELDHRVIETVQVGFILHGKLIRPARVRIGEFKK